MKTPDARPKVVLLALCKTSSSVTNGIMDITGPKISSFTQVISSLQLSMNGATYKRNQTFNLCIAGKVILDYIKATIRLMLIM